MWRLGWAHPLCPRGAWVLPQCCAHPYTHLTLGLPAWGLGTPTTHTWRLGTPRPNYLWASHSAEPKIALGHWLCRAQNRFGLLLHCWVHHCTHIALGLPAWGLGTPQRTRGAWAALGMSMPAPHLGTPGAWVMPLNPKGMGPASRPKFNGSCARTSF